MSLRPITGFTRKGKVSGAPFKGSKAGWMMDHGRMCSSSSDPSMIHPSITADACMPDRTGRELLLPDALSRPGRRRDARETRREETHGRLPAACLMNPWQIRDRRSVQFTWREAVGGDNNFGWSRGRRRAAAAVTSSSHSPPPVHHPRSPLGRRTEPHKFGTVSGDRGRRELLNLASSIKWERWITVKS